MLFWRIHANENTSWKTRSIFWWIRIGKSLYCFEDCAFWDFLPHILSICIQPTLTSSLFSLSSLLHCRVNGLLIHWFVFSIEHCNYKVFVAQYPFQFSIVSTQLLLDILLALTTQSNLTLPPLLTPALTGLCCTWLNHLNWFSFIFFFNKSNIYSPINAHLFSLIVLISSAHSSKQHPVYI